MAFWFLYHKMRKVLEHTFSDYFVFPFGKWDHIFFRTMSTTLFPPPQRKLNALSDLQQIPRPGKGGKDNLQQWSRFPTLMETPSLPISEIQDQVEILLLTELPAQNLQVCFTLCHNIHGCLLPLPSFKDAMKSRKEGRNPCSHISFVWILPLKT